MSLKVFVKFSLHVGNTADGCVSPAGARLYKGEPWPNELLEKDGKTLKFTFDKADEATYAAKALEKYLEKNP